MYGLRTWIAYGVKHIKPELGWADHRLTDSTAIERWWERVCSASLMVSVQTPARTAVPNAAISIDVRRVQQHPWWQAGGGWNHTRNTLRLLIHPFWCWYLVLPWLTVVPLPGRSDGLQPLVKCINHDP